MRYKKTLIIFLLLLIFFGMGIRFLSIDKAYAADETDFVKPAESIIEVGRPILYQSEQKPFDIALWHPPMYVFSLSLVFRFIKGEIGARIVNVVFSILTFIFIFLFCSRMIKGERGKIIGLISGSFFLINYYVFSSSIVIDIDMLSTFFVSAFVFSIILNYQTKRKIFLFFAGLFLFFALFNRTPIVVLVYLAIGIYYYFNKELKKDFRLYFFMGFFSFICFIIVWGFYSVFVEPGNFFSFIFHNTRLGSEQFLDLSVYVGSFFLNIVQIIRLFTFPAVLLMIWVLFYFFKRKDKLIRILMIYLLSVLVLFLIVPRPAFGYPRYFVSLFPGLAVLLGIFIYENLKNVKINGRLCFIIFLSFLVCFGLLIFFNPQLTVYYSGGLVKAINVPDFLFNILASVPIFFVFFFRENRRKILIIILLTLVLSYSLYFDVKLMNNKLAMKEIGSYIKEVTNEDEIIISPKAVAYYAERKYYANNFKKPPLDNFSLSFVLEYIKKSFENREMDDEFFWEGGFYSGVFFEDFRPSIEEMSRASYAVLHHRVEGEKYERKIGDFYIYNLKD